MNATFRTILVTSTALTALAASATALASGPKDSPAPADRHGYAFRVGPVDVHTDGARMSQRDVFTDGGNMGKRDIFGDGARGRGMDPWSDGADKLAGMDRTGVSGDPSRKLDTFQDGTHA